jgi:hypothetical protein
MALSKIVRDSLNTGIDDNSDATAITIDSSEKVGIGDTSPLGNKVHIRTAGSATSVNGDAGLVLESDDSTRCDLQFMGPDGAFQSVYFGDVSDDNRGIIAYSHSGNNMRFTVDASERMRLTSDGLTFNGDTAAANALNDYEEGTFTPTFTGASTAGSITYVVQDGRYVKIGKQVTLWIRFQYSAFSGSAGTIRVGGFPYASESGTHAHGLSSNWLSFGNPIPSGWPIFYISGGTSHANALISKDNTSWADWASSDFHLTSGTKYFNLNIFYKTA